MVEFEVAKILYWQQRQCYQWLLPEQNHVSKATWSRFCTEWNRFKQPSFTLGSDTAMQFATTETLVGLSRAGHFCSWKSKIVLMHASVTLTQDKRMSDVLWFVVWAEEVLKAVLCNKSEFNSLCAKRFSSHSRRSHTDQHSCTDTHSPLVFLMPNVMKDAMHQEAREVKFWFRWIVQAGCYGLRLLIESSLAEKQLKVMEGIMEMWFIGWIWKRR